MALMQRSMFRGRRQRQRDHLGNTRVRFADKDGNGEIEVDEEMPEEDELLASSHYYPFG